MTDYSGRSFPNAACILDYLRCSITVASIKDMVVIVDSFVKKIESSTVNTGCVIDICRIKNGFGNCLKWSKLDDYSYVDVKLNVLIYDPITKLHQIAEVQFFPKFMLDAKKMGHKYYQIVRKQEYIQTIKNMMTNDGLQDRYSNKIKVFIDNNNYTQLTKQICSNYNLVLSMLSVPDGWHTVIPHLAMISGKNLKMKQFYFGALIHYNKHILGNLHRSELNDNKENKEKTENKTNDDSKELKNPMKGKAEFFLQNYLTIHKQRFLIGPTTFFGVNWHTENRPLLPDSKIYQFMEMIMKNEFFDGVSQGVSKDWLTRCIKENYYHYVKLILKYGKKNEECIIKGLTLFENDPDKEKYSKQELLWGNHFAKESVLIALLKCNNCNDEWLNCLLFDVLNAVSADKVKYGKKTLDHAYYICKSEVKNDKWADMILKYANATNQEVDTQFKPPNTK